MANQSRPPIATAEEIIAWAEKTREANGEAFTMLNKAEQLNIAKFILAMRDHIKTIQSQKPEETKTEQNDTKAPPTDVHSDEESKKDNGAPDDGEILVRDIPVKRQTNMEYFKANNVSMQRAFQLYQTWADCDPANRIIIDEKRKAYIKSASFAFWLHLPHE